MINFFLHSRRILTLIGVGGFVRLLCLSVLASVFDLFGVTGLFVLLSMLIDQENKLVDLLVVFVDYVELINLHNFDIRYLLSITVALSLVAGVFVRLFAINQQYKFSYFSEVVLSEKILKLFFASSYERATENHSSRISSAVLSETAQIVNGVIMPINNIIVHGISAMGIVVALFFINKTFFVFLSFVFLCFYGGLYIVISPRLNRFGNIRKVAVQQKFKSIAEVFFDIRYVKLKNIGDFFIKRYIEAAKQYAEAQANAQFLAVIPRFSIEVVVYITLVGAIGLSLNQKASGAVGVLTWVPVATTFLMAGFRLLPSVQQVFVGFSSLKYSESVLAHIGALLVPAPSSIDDEAFESYVNKPDPSLFSLNQVSYKFPGSEKLVIDGVNLHIQEGECIGIVGPSGEGKSTLIDLLVGLRRPTSGSISLRNRNISTFSDIELSKMFGYVPQTVRLIDDVLAKNVSMSIGSAVDCKKVRKALKLSNLERYAEDKIMNSLYVGELGGNLSGGEVQRVGIARALYDSPEILIFDEFTSALDQKSQLQILREVEALKSLKTIIMIAHRPEVLSICDRIITLKNGRIAKVENHIKKPSVVPK